MSCVPCNDFGGPMIHQPPALELTNLETSRCSWFKAQHRRPTGVPPSKTLLIRDGYNPLRCREGPL